MRYCGFAGIGTIQKSAALLLLGGVLAFSGHAVAQCADDTPGGLRSNGIQGAVAYTKKVPNSGVIGITIDLKNTTRNIAHVMTVGNYYVSSSSGGRYSKTSGEVGASFCLRSSGDDTGNLSACMKDRSDDITNYSDIDACGTARITLYFINESGKDAPPGSTLNYIYRAIVRYSPVSEDPLLADKPASQPRIVTLNFPPIPSP